MAPRGWIPDDFGDPLSSLLVPSLVKHLRVFVKCLLDGFFIVRGSSLVYFASKWCLTIWTQDIWHQRESTLDSTDVIHILLKVPTVIINNHTSSIPRWWYLWLEAFWFQVLHRYVPFFWTQYSSNTYFWPSLNNSFDIHDILYRKRSKVNFTVASKCSAKTCLAIIQTQDQGLWWRRTSAGWLF